jgi:predicted lipid-binding transport protein (Tim44 family)
MDMMNQGFDPFNLVLLAIVLVVFWRLRTVLGRKTGNEKPPLDITPPARKSADVIPMPGSRQSGTDQPEDEQEPVWKGYAAEGSATAKALEEIARASPGFAMGPFMAGAKVAYEMIVESFAKGDKTTLKPLLSPEVFDGFREEIDRRAKDGASVSLRFVGIDKVEIVSAQLQNRRAAITIRFVSEIISATRDREGKVTDGDEREIREVSDIWTFERDVSQRDPNWKLAATDTLLE